MIVRVGRPGARTRGGPVRVWLDGRLVPADAPHLPVTDRGFQLGDGVFETLRARRGVVIELDEHLERLHESATAIVLPLPSDARLTAAIGELLEAEELAERGLPGPERPGGEVDRGDGAGGARERPPGDAAVRITVSRGPLARRGLLPDGWDAIEATVAIQAWPYRPADPELLERGVSAVPSSIRRDPASPLAGIKSTSRADHVFARLEAGRAGADEAIFCTIDGRLSEATTANLFVVTPAGVLTPPRSAAILAGTTRTWLLAEARAGRLRVGPDGGLLTVEERDLVRADLLAADEAFLSSSVAGIVPLTRFEDQPIGNGRPGPVTRALRAARETWIDAVALEAIAALDGTGS